MPDHINFNCWLIGAGPMAIEYAKVLSALDVQFRTIGRGSNSARHFEVETGLKVKTGGVAKELSRTDKVPTVAIVAVPVKELFNTTKTLIEAGVKRFLVEKPGVLCLTELESLKVLCEEHQVTICFAFNRRFFPSVKKLKKELTENTALSCSFEFTEWSHKIEGLDKDPSELRRWMWANSSHLIDLVFYLIGTPNADFYSARTGYLTWHPSGSNFVGAGVTEKECLFNYTAKWNSAGRWKMSVATLEGEYSLEPLEQLNFQKKGQLNKVKVDGVDAERPGFKDGLFELVDSFINHKNTDILVSIGELESLQKVVQKIAGYED